MTVLYKPYQSSVVSKSGKKLFYPRVVRTGNVGTSTIAEEIAEYSSLSRGDVKNTIDNLITVLTRHLQDRSAYISPLSPWSGWLRYDPDSW